MRLTIIASLFPIKFVTDLKSYLPDLIVSERLCSEFENDSRQDRLQELITWSEIALIILDPKSDSEVRNGLRFLSELTQRYPYLPVVVVGVPRDKLISFSRLGGARLLETPVRPEVVARELRSAYHTAWWFVVRQFELPTMLIDSDGRVVRANDVAIDQFGNDLVGKWYRQGVEGEADRDLPPGHPIRDALGKGRIEVNSSRPARGVSSYHEFGPDKQNPRRAILICTPILGLRNQIQAVAVLLIEMNTWSQIFQAVERFAPLETSEDVYNEIVAQAKQLGFSRVRLYKAVNQGRFLKGVACAGFQSPENEAFFRETLRIDIRNDRPTQITKERRMPCVCVRDWAGTLQSETNLYADVPDYEPLPELEMDSVNRWIEVPLWIVRDHFAAKRELEFWGKLCVDLGIASDQIDAQHVSNAATFGSVANAAIADIYVRDRNQRFQNLLRDLRQEFATADWHKPNNRIFINVLRLLQSLLLQMTEGSVARFLKLEGRSFKFFHDELLGAPIEVGESKFQDDFSGFQEYLLQVDDHGTVLGGNGLRPCVVALGPKHDADTNRNGDSSNVAVVIPVVVQGVLRGVLVALSRHDPIAEYCSMRVLEQFMTIASFWFEFSELHDTKVPWSDSLQNVVEVLPLLAAAQDFERLYAGVAAILSANTGLGWNRVLIFRCETPTPGTAELAYAVGGMGEDFHPTIMQRAKLTDPTLLELVKKRIIDPLPYGQNDQGQTEVDTLFKNWVIQQSVRVSYGHDLPERDNPLRVYLTDEGFKGDLPVVLPIDTEDEPYWASLSRSHEGLFCTKKAYLFPVWRFFDEGRRPIAFVITDNPHTTRSTETELCSLTRMVLDLIGDILAAREEIPLIRNLLGVLDAFRHGKSLLAHWHPFKDYLNELLEVVPLGLYPAENLSELKRQRDELADRVAEIDQAQVTLLQRLSLEPRNSKDPPIALHLGQWFDVFLEDWKTANPTVRFEGPEKPLEVIIPVDKQIMNGVMKMLVLNAVNASIRNQDNHSPEVLIRVCQEPSTSPAFRHFVAIRVTDSGTGVSSKVAPHIFIDGFTHDPNSDTDGKTLRSIHFKGRGLCVARAQVLLCSGDIALENTGSAPDPRDPTRRMGATFVLRFGIPNGG